MSDDDPIIHHEVTIAEPWRPHAISPITLSAMQFPAFRDAVEKSISLGLGIPPTYVHKLAAESQAQEARERIAQWSGTVEEAFEDMRTAINNSIVAWRHRKFIERMMRRHGFKRENRASLRRRGRL